MQCDFLRAAADASAKLVKLRQAEALGMLDDHHGGVGHIDANFHDGGGNEDLHFIFVEALHDLVFFIAGKPAVQEPELQLRKDLFRKALVFVDGRFQLELGLFDDRINDVALAPRSYFAAERFPDTR